MKPENVKCPECAGPMVSRLNRQKNQRFWGCAAYPECRGTRDTDGEAPRRNSQDDDAGREDAPPSRVWADRDKQRWRA